MNYYLLNVFAKEGVSGNQLAVVFPESELSVERMREFTRNFNFSETVFVRGTSVRIFTPGGELAFAGHPTVGTAWLLHHLKLQPSEFSLHAPLGEVKVQASAHDSKVTFPGKPVLRDFTGDLAEILEHSKVQAQDVYLDQVQLVSSGPEFLIIPLKSFEALKHAQSPLSSKQAVKCYYIHEQDSQNVNVRMFAPLLSVPEDPATGSAACALAAYLQSTKKRESGSLSVHQGEFLGRPSLIQLNWDRTIEIGGKVMLWAQGRLA